MNTEKFNEFDPINEDDHVDSMTLKDKLSSWAVKNRVSVCVLDQLLAIVNKFFPFVSVN